MLEEIMLDKARIVREAADEWVLASENFASLMNDPGVPWADPDAMVVDWLGTRVEKVMGMTEAELRRAAKSYLNTWVRDESRRRAKAALPEGAAEVEATTWPEMVEDLVRAERVARRKAGKKNLDVWIAPKGKVTIGGELVDYTSHEFWTDMYLYALERPRREGESRTAFVRRMGDAGANAKYASEKMPQPHNGTARHYSVSVSPSDSLAAGMDGKFDEDYQTTHRGIGMDRRPMDLREVDWMERPVSTRLARPGEIAQRKADPGRRWATEPLCV